MNFQISKADLVPILTTAMGVIERNPHPILNCVKVATEASSLTVTANNYEVELTSSTQCTTDTGEVEEETLITARKLLTACKSFGKGAVIEVTVDENTGIATISSGTSQFELPTFAVEDFPEMERPTNPDVFKISQRQLKNAFAKTSFCVATNDVRYYLIGVYLEIGDGKITFVSTDGHRMAVVQQEFDSTLQIHGIIPLVTVKALLKLLTDSESEVIVSLDNNQIRFEISDATVVTSKLVDGLFPAWEKAIPEYPDKKVVVNSKRMIIALTSALLLSDKSDYMGVTLCLAPDRLVLSAKNKAGDKSRVTLKTAYSGDDLEISFNASYLIDVLKVLSTSNAVLEFTDSKGSVLITEEGSEESKYVVMPMRL